MRLCVSFHASLSSVGIVGCCVALFLVSSPCAFQSASIALWAAALLGGGGVECVARQPARPPRCSERDQERWHLWLLC